MHLQTYRDELAFRHNRGKTDVVTRIATRVIESDAERPLLTMLQLQYTTTRPAGTFFHCQPQLPGLTGQAWADCRRRPDPEPCFIPARICAARFRRERALAKRQAWPIRRGFA